MHESDILAKIPGQFVAAASTMLPEAETAAEATLETIIEVPGQRRVRFTLNASATSAACRTIASGRRSRVVEMESP